MTRKLTSTMLLVASFWGFSLCAIADADAAAVITKFHVNLVTMMKTDGYEARLALMGPVIRENFDTRTVARVALGRNWRRLSTEDQSELTGLLAEVMASGYVSRLPDYTNQQFETGSSTPIVPDRMIIKSKLQTGSETVGLDYQLIDIKGQWRIFDVVAEGVSDLALKRGSYTETFRTKGLEGLIVEIKQTIVNNGLKYSSKNARQ